jgi:magnesium-transporting ATPase (P-type)
MVTVILIQNVLLLAFGIGLLRVARRRSVWWIGVLLVAEFVIVGIPTHTFWAMSSRDMATGFNDTMHITLSVVFSLLVVAMMVLSAVAYRGWFRLYSVATMAVVVGLGMTSSLAIRGIEQNDTLWAGGFERINAYAYFAWLVILAVMVIRHELGPSQTKGELGGSRSEVPVAA